VKGLQSADVAFDGFSADTWGKGGNPREKVGFRGRIRGRDRAAVSPPNKLFEGFAGSIIDSSSGAGEAVPEVERDEIGLVNASSPAVPEGFSDLMRYWMVEGSILVPLSQDVGSIDPHIWAIDERLPVLAGARDKQSFSTVGAGCVVQGSGSSLRHNQILAILRICKFYFGKGIYWICPVFGGGMGPMFNLQNPKTGLVSGSEC
jgi:hypothetical protein